MRRNGSPVRLPDIERRVFDARAKKDSPTISGYIAQFNTLSMPMWGFREQIAPGAFRETIEADDIRALFNHDSNIVLARKSPRHSSLTLREDGEGLYTEFTPPDTSAARDLVTMMRADLVDQASFQFATLEDHWDEVNDELIRTLIKVRLYDVSPVTFPAYRSTNVKVRSVIAEAGLDPEPIEQVLITARRGAMLSTEQRAIVGATIELLNTFLPVQEKPVRERRCAIELLDLSTRLAEALSGRGDRR